MAPENGRLSYLFSKYLENTISSGELEELFGHIRHAKKNRALKEQIMEVFRKTRSVENAGPVNWEAMFSGIVERPERSIRLPVWKMVAAALVVILAGSAVFFYLNRHPARRVVAQTEPISADILPGGNKALLTLANGNTITLDNAMNGRLAGQPGVSIIKLSSGELTYKKEPQGQKKQETPFNTLSTPRGGQYKLVLADGTKVWLNAASSIRYPAVFTGRERKVEITGEAYFEVIHNEKMPFRVMARGEMIEDLGTRFNVSAYEDEPVMKTTLLEGLVKIRATVLQPGQQADIYEKGRSLVVRNVQVEDAVAWKNGFFAFRNDDLETVVRKLSRWYDIKVRYQSAAGGGRQQFSGRIDRSLTLSQVIDGLSQAKAHFRIGPGGEVVILP